MRLEPSEEFMYKRIDWKERLLLLFPLLGILGTAGLLMMVSGRERFGGGILVGLSLGGSMLNWAAYWSIQRRIMPLSRCFLEVQSDCFTVVQPFRDGIYESCKIYFAEIESLVEERKGKGFYIRISGGGKSVVQREERGRVMYVSSKGYEREKFEAVYKRVKGKILEQEKIYGCK